MLRVVLLELVMFLLPFFIYGIYVYWFRQAEPGEGGIWADAPLAWLAVAGIVLMLIAITLLIQFTGDRPGGVYVPPRFEDGVLKPGHFE